MGLRRFIAGALALAALAGGSARAQGAKGEVNVEERPFAVPDAAFWTDMWANRQAVYDRATRTPRCLLADGPRQVDLAARETAPVGVLHFAPTLHHARAPFENHALVVAARVEDGLVVAGRAAERLPMVPPVPPGLTEESGNTAHQRAVDLFLRPGIPREPGTWHVRYVLGDLVSNRVTVELVGATRCPQVALAGDPWPAPRDPRPRYAPSPEGPPAPAEGVALVATAAVLIDPFVAPPEGDPDADPDAAQAAAGPRGPLLVRGAVRVTLAPRPGPDATGAAPPPPVLPVTLVVTGSVRAYPVVLPLRLPCHALEGDVATAHFELDLGAFAEVPTDTVQTLYVFAFAPGGHMAGPVAIALVAAGDVGLEVPGR